jgi:NADH dehydrogenase (ubiquinone) Fe-S protein 7
MVKFHLAVKPAASLVPYRAFAAAPSFVASSRRDASSLTPHGGAGAFASARKEVPLPSEERPKSVIQYALYDSPCSDIDYACPATSCSSSI